jgi:hypothetical protein
MKILRIIKEAAGQQKSTENLIQQGKAENSSKLVSGFPGKEGETKDTSQYGSGDRMAILAER